MVDADGEGSHAQSTVRAVGEAERNLTVTLSAPLSWVRDLSTTSAAGIQMLKLHSEDISKDAADLITGMLVEDPRQRLSTKQILEHPWLVSTQSAQGGGKSNGRSHLERAPVV